MKKHKHGLSIYWAGDSAVKSKNAEKLYADAIQLARRPEFFEKYGVADDVDGRFDALSLIVILVMRRLKSLGGEGKDLSQALFDSMFADMDLSLREMGAGDIGVSKRVRTDGRGFYGPVGLLCDCH